MVSEKPDVVVAGFQERLDAEAMLAAARAIGAASALVLTGNTAADDVLLPRPDWVFEDLHELTAALSTTARGT